MKYHVVPALFIALVASLAACQQPPTECDCNCEEAVAQALAEASSSEAAAQVPAPQEPRPAATSRTVAPRPQGTARRGSVRARGAVSTRPGTGSVVQRTTEERAAMQKTFTDFLAAAEARKLGPIVPHLTDRLGTVLQQKADQYEPRFFRGLEETLGQVSSGVEMAETRDAGQGNVEALFRFGSGHERRVVFFHEEGGWKLNRL